MANISGLLGTAGGFKGTGVSAPNVAFDQGKIDTTYANTQDAIEAQKALLAAIQAQNGLQNQSNVYQQLQGIVSGTGPNPAQTMLAKATGANAAQQATAAAGQRGSSKNVGMIARQAAQAGGAANQTAAADAATLQANQSLAALTQAGGMSNTMAANQIGQTNANTAANTGLLNTLAGSNAQQNAVNAGLIGATAQQQAAVGGGAMQGMGGAMAAMADGGQVPSKSDNSAFTADSKFGPQSNIGKFFQSTSIPSNQDPLTAGVAALGKGIGTMIHNYNATPTSPQSPDAQFEGSGFSADQISQERMRQDAQNIGGLPADGMAKGGKVPVMLSKGERILEPEDVKSVAMGHKDPLKAGRKVPGTPEYPGNDYRNDVVPSKEKAGTLVIPNSVLQSKSPHWAALRFVQAHMANGGKLPTTLYSKKKTKKK